MTLDERKDAVEHVLMQMYGRMREYNAKDTTMTPWELSGWYSVIAQANGTMDVEGMDGSPVAFAKHPDVGMPWAALGMGEDWCRAFNGLGDETGVVGHIDPITDSDPSLPF